MTDSELATWDAVQTAEAIRSGQVSAEEVLDAAIARVEENAHLGAAVTRCFERARGPTASAHGPLAGVPTFIKDLLPLRGVATTWGSRASGHYVPRTSDPFVERFERTGVAVLGKSATPELGLTATTEPLRDGPCRNPWNPERSSGGSSGGAAALVAAGVVPIAHASDGGGSIRIPASCCGLVGLKPSRHRLDMTASPLLPVNIASDGVLSRTVRDTVAFFAALEQHKPPRKVAPIGPVGSQPKAPLRVGVFVDSPAGTEVDSDNRDAALDAGTLCESLGHHVDQIPCPFDGAVIGNFLHLWGYVAWLQTFGGRLLMHARWDNTQLEPFTVGMCSYFTRSPVAAAKAIRRLRGFGSAYDEVLRRYDVLICPTVAAPPPEIGHLATDLPFEAAFDRLRTYVAFTPIQNVSGAPSISLPLGRSRDGMPVGVQFAAAHGGDRLLLELARSIEAAAPWPLAAPTPPRLDPR